MYFLSNSIFGLKHIIILIVCVGLIVAGSILSIKKIKKPTFHKILLIVGIVSETLKIFSYILANEAELGGYLPKTDLPFHLCSIQLIFIALLNFSKNDKLKHLLESFMIPTCLIGGVAALFIATSSSLNMWVITFQYFIYHSAIIVFAIYLLATEKYTVKDYLHTIALLAFIFVLAIYINSMLYFKNDAGEYVNINFMYVVSPPQSGLPFLNENHGWFVYIVHYILLAIFVITLTFIKPIINSFKKEKVEEKIAEEPTVE